MCDICTAKAKKISELAHYFREKANETEAEYYIKKMIEAAASLDELAKRFSAHCRCGDELYQPQVERWEFGTTGVDEIHRPGAPAASLRRPATDAPAAISVCSVSRC
jgi:hypothetical protein